MTKNLTAGYSFIEQLLPSLVLVSTVIMGCGVALTMLTKQPAAKQRIGELSVLSVLVWLSLTVIPIQTPLDLSDANSAATTHAKMPVATLPNKRLARPDQPDSAAALPPIKQHRDRQHRDKRSSSRTLEGAPAGSSWSFKTLSAVEASWLTRLYLSGAAVLLILMLVGRLTLYHVLQRAQPAPDWLLRIYAELPHRRMARVVVCDRGMPFSCGLFRPMIVIPRKLCQLSNQISLKDVLLHEQAHVARYDAVGHALVNLALPLLCFQPLYELEGDVEYVEPMVAADGTLTLVATVKNKLAKSGDWLLIPGMSGELMFVRE